MGDIVERLREQPTMSSFANIGDMVGRLNHEREEAADEIERLREAIRQADCVLQLLAPENHSQTTEAEMASLLSSISEKLSRMVEEWDSAALGGEE